MCDSKYLFGKPYHAFVMRKYIEILMYVARYIGFKAMPPISYNKKAFGYV